MSSCFRQRHCFMYMPVPPRLHISCVNRIHNSVWLIVVRYRVAYNVILDFQTSVNSVTNYVNVVVLIRIDFVMVFPHKLVSIEWRVYTVDVGLNTDRLFLYTLTSMNDRTFSMLCNEIVGNSVTNFQQR